MIIKIILKFNFVILHELTHLLYPNHSKDFYDFLTIQMPDWKEKATGCECCPRAIKRLQNVS